MRSWLFIFGRTPDLSFLELSVLVDAQVMRLLQDVARVEASLSPEELIRVLGGTVKIARGLGSVAVLTPETLLPFFGDEYKTFGISTYGDTKPVDVNVLREIKKALEDRGQRARYVVPKNETALSSVVVAKQAVHELVVIKMDEGYVVGETVAVQDFEAWNKRDYGRPFADPRAGMLPPKVARMAVNIANESKVKSQKSKVLLDPFCGMGTIITEAALTGWKVIGSDQSEEAIEKAKKNLEWLLRSHSAQFFISDATHVSEHIPAESVDVVVTEPYLGPAFGGNDQFPISNNQLKNIIKGLEKLYIGCLRDWYRVLKPGGKIVIALPEYAINSKTFFVKSVIDRCETLGYTVTAGPLPYSREHAIVRRKFYVLVKLG